jgi:NAD(P)-dependent dehydrogenase (short-subunit alcohol dehydrogenase family)
MSLEGKVAIVTGASRGIGRAIATHLAANAATVVATGRDQSQLATTGLSSIALDLRIPEAPQQLVDFALARHGRIDIIVSNAGATKRGDFLNLTDADFADGFALKYFGAVRLTRAAWPHLKSTQGTLVFIAGVGGKTPGAQFTIGGSVNAALLSFTKAMAELGAQDNVQVNAINPGTIRTGRMAARFPTPEAEAAFVRSANVTRIGEPSDIAALTAFVVSPQGRFLHGSLLDMDGGATKSL